MVDVFEASGRSVEKETYATCGEAYNNVAVLDRLERRPTEHLKAYFLSYTSTLSTGLPSGPTPLWVTVLVFPSREISHFSMTSFLPFRYEMRSAMLLSMRLSVTICPDTAPSP